MSAHLNEAEREALIVKVAMTIHTNESHPDYPDYDEVPCSGQAEAHCAMGHEHGSRGVCWCCEPGAAAVVDDVLAPFVAAAVAAEREAWVGKIEALADAWADDTGIEGYINLGEAEDRLRALIAEARPLERGTELPSEPGTDLEARS